MSTIRDFTEKNKILLKGLLLTTSHGSSSFKVELATTPTPAWEYPVHCLLYKLNFSGIQSQSFAGQLRMTAFLTQ